MTEPLLCELSVAGRKGILYPEPDVPRVDVPPGFLRKELPLPELSEVDVTRHFTRLSQLNYCIDLGMYPLGSCTMKYNPKINEETSRLPGLSMIHPMQPIETVQGALLLMYELQEYLKEIAGFSGITLQPAAGGQPCGNEQCLEGWVQHPAGFRTGGPGKAESDLPGVRDLSSAGAGGDADGRGAGKHAATGGERRSGTDDCRQ